MGPIRAIIAIAGLAASASAYPADAPSGKPMKMDEPMRGEMKKNTMKKGDVRKAAEKKARELKAMMEKEAAGAAKK
ncbi:MAG TPA: hypothetical protein VH867_04640 [Burkholderiales bacterium]|jgi:hypothetical protein